MRRVQQAAALKLELHPLRGNHTPGTLGFESLDNGSYRVWKNGLDGTTVPIGDLQQMPTVPALWSTGGLGLLKRSDVPLALGVCVLLLRLWGLEEGKFEPASFSDAAPPMAELVEVLQQYPSVGGTALSEGV